MPSQKFTDVGIRVRGVELEATVEADIDPGDPSIEVTQVLVDGECVLGEMEPIEIEELCDTIFALVFQNDEIDY